LGHYYFSLIPYPVAQQLKRKRERNVREREEVVTRMLRPRPAVIGSVAAASVSLFYFLFLSLVGPLTHHWWPLCGGYNPVSGPRERERKKRPARTRLARHTRPLRKRKVLTIDSYSWQHWLIFDHKVINAPWIWVLLLFFFFSVQPPPPRNIKEK
jgi:hypothetical protein